MNYYYYTLLGSLQVHTHKESTTDFCCLYKDMPPVTLILWWAVNYFTPTLPSDDIWNFKAFTFPYIHILKHSCQHKINMHMYCHSSVLHNNCQPSAIMLHSNERKKHTHNTDFKKQKPSWQVHSEQLVKELPTFYHACRLTAVFTITYHWILSQLKAAHTYTLHLFHDSL